MNFTVPEKLCESQLISDFDCGNHDLNRFLKKHAFINQASNNSTTYTTSHQGKVVGYYTITLASITHKNAPKTVTSGQPRYPIPVMLLARLAIDQSQQGKGVGRALLKDAFLRALMVSDIVGCRAFLIHAKDDVAKQWYMQFAMEESPTDPLHLFVLIQDLKNCLDLSFSES